jgi:hypothetical protein
MRSALVAAFVAGSLVFASEASAAAPRYILFSSRALPHPVLLDDWSENLDFLAAISTAPRVRAAELRHRPRFLASLFWSSDVWPEPPRSPEGADQRAWYYPAFGRRSAAFEIERSSSFLGLQPRRATASFLAILARHRIPGRCAMLGEKLACR